MSAMTAPERPLLAWSNLVGPAGVLIVAVSVLCLTVAFGGLTVTVEHVPASVCTEDMACWDCETMGNGVCGVKP